LLAAGLPDQLAEPAGRLGDLVGVFGGEHLARGVDPLKRSTWARFTCPQELADRLVVADQRLVGDQGLEEASVSACSRARR